ncbi:hydantoinase/oxoprolinase family protein [Telluria beijingensis]|uniref:hydantoinase/oxoprolinase family protein n=1 Tax=Telluria beijingensis TaxID=3068633 RepID=UPI0027958FCC|nr:hydantoinase/oxoprolinase family protein [Massilia sp. REN29]
MTKRIGIDVGGTFTDFVLLDRASGKVVHHKEPSTPADPAQAVQTGLGALMKAAGIAPRDVELIVHGTTISLNTLLQRRGVRVGLVTTSGLKDVLELARIRMSHSYDFFATPDEPFVPRDKVIEIGARVATDGGVVHEPDARACADVAAAVAASEVDVLVVSILNGHMNPAFEARVARALAERLPGLPVVAATMIWSEMREYERTMIAVMNAYVEPIMRAYYGNIDRIFREYGFEAPLSITSSNGGTIDLDTARARPIDTILSGPAAGVVAAASTSVRAGIDRIVTFDMGGTSADIAIIENGAPDITTESSIGEVPLILPVVNVSAIGAGGGSIIRAIDGGVLKVGPGSAGADPGPACYGRGGTAPTITDCYLACGFLDPESFLGGRLALSRDAAHRALDGIAKGLGYGEDANAVPRAAEAALKVASSMMATEVRKLLARRGSDADRFTLVPYGGAGSTHVAFLAQEAGIDRILVPETPATFCALGAVVANLRRDFVRSCAVTVGAGGVLDERLARDVAELRDEALAWAEAMGSRAQDWELLLAADMRYPGQAFDLTVEQQLQDDHADLGAGLHRLFEDKHQRLYGFTEAGRQVELVRLVVSAVGKLSSIASASPRAQEESGERRRRVFLDGQWNEVRRVHRNAIVPGAPLAGPCIVEQADTTVVVPGQWQAVRLETGDLLLTRVSTVRAGEQQ